MAHTYLLALKKAQEKSPSVDPPIKEKTGSVKLYLLFVEAVGCGTPGPGWEVPVGIPVWPCLALCECPASLFVLRDACAHHPPTIEWLCKGPGASEASGRLGAGECRPARREGSCISPTLSSSLSPPTQWQGGKVLNDNF